MFRPENNAKLPGPPAPVPAAAENPLDSYCLQAEERGASDLFLHEGLPPRLRVEGALVEFPGARPVSAADLAPLNAASGASPSSVERDFHYVASFGSRFRAQLHRVLGRQAAVLRLIRSRILPLDTLGLPDRLLRDWILRPSGLILVTGPAGSGKSTTIASLLDWLNDAEPRHVVTIEDPVEYVFESRTCLFTQREVPVDTLSFAEGLRSGLRQSPDILFVGEIRDPETANVALQASETGHLVVSTLHSASVAQSLERLAHLFPTPLRDSALALLAQQLIGILSQKLLPGLDGTRVAVAEYLVNEAAARDWVRTADHASLADFMRRDQAGQSRDFLRSILEAWRAGKIGEDAALGAVNRRAELRQAMAGISLR